MTQRDLGLAVGYSETHITRLETGQRLPDLIAVKGSFVEALDLKHDPELAKRFIELATAARGEPIAPASQKLASAMSSQASRNNLLAQLTRLIGREREIAEIEHLINESRLVTLTGAGGVGKTRLAHKVGAGLLAQFPDGLWFISLAALTDATLILQVIATTLKLPDAQRSTQLDVITAHFETRHALLILDNCEHMIAACAELIVYLLEHCPGLHVLTTSRETLRVLGEVVYRVPSLTVPPTSIGAEDPRHYESVQLFVERAHASQLVFELTANNTAAVVQISRRLDGIPLALELAAAQVNALSVEQIAARLGHIFQLLGDGGRTVLPRHRTLNAAIAWSYELLTPPERDLLAKLAVFRDGFTVEAAETMYDQADGFNILSHLVDKSLVVSDTCGQMARYRLLEIIRQFALNQLHASSKLSLTSERHAAFFLTWAELTEPDLFGATQKEWLDSFEHEHDNLRAALTWYSNTVRDTQSALRLAAALGRFWRARGYWIEGRRWIEELLVRESILTTARAKALQWAGWFARNQGEGKHALQRCGESVAAFQQLGDKRGTADALIELGWIVYSMLGFSHATSHFEESLRLFRELGDKQGIAHALNGLAHMATMGQVNYSLASAYLHESLALYRELDNAQGIAETAIAQGNIAWLQGNSELASVAYSESLASFQELGSKHDIAWACVSLGEIESSLSKPNNALPHLETGLMLFQELQEQFGIAIALHHIGQLKRDEHDLDNAERNFAHSLEICRAMDKNDLAARCVAALAGIALDRSMTERATRLLSAAQQYFDAAISFLAPADKARYERDIAAVRMHLDEAIFTNFWTAGKEMPLSIAINEALAMNQSSKGL